METTKSEVYGIYPTNISLTISGINDQQWVAYAFNNNAFDDNDFDDEDLDDELCSSDGFHEDPIASNGAVDANLPVWNPRIYFLIIFEIRMHRALNEWTFLVRWIERHIGAQVCWYSFILPNNTHKKG